MLFTSCMRDETRLDEGSIVTFKISAPAVSTRAAIEDTYGTGVAADDLHWAIFEADDNGAAVGDAIFSNVEEGFFADDALENTFNVRLVKGKKYVGMFWAQANGAPYTVAWPEVTMGEVNSNDEDLDAFFNIHPFSITAGQETGEQKVELRRPFAQLNVAIPATDLAAAKAAGFELAKTGVTLNVAKSLNLVTGKVGTAEDVTYNLANIPSDVTATLEGTEYQLISFNYVLVDGDAWTTESDEGQELKDVTFNYGTADETLSQTFSNIAIERNHRTYIVGSLLSETVDFRVIILPDWEDPYYLNNMEAGTIELVAEQTKASNTGLGVATIAWNAVEGAAYYGVEYKGEELDQVLPDGSTRADEEATAPAILSYTTKPNTVEGASGTFTIKAYNENDKVIARVVTESIPVFSLADVRTPKMVIENNTLTVNDCYNLSSVMMDLTVNFKDKEGVVKYSARHYKNHTNDTDPNANAWGYDSGSQINAGRFTKQYYYSFANGKTWMWTLADGSTVNSTTLPEMAAGEYTVEYTATYYAILNGYWAKKISSNPSVYGPADGEADSDRVMFDGEAADVCTATEPITGELGTYKVEGFGGTVTAVAEGYQGAKLTWDAAEGAAKYEVYVGDEKVAEATTNEATVTGLDKARTYTFKVKAYNEGGAKLPGEPTSAEIEIYTVAGVKDLEYTFENGTFTIVNTLNLHATALHIKAEFVKDGVTKHTAEMDKTDLSDYGAQSNYNVAGCIDNYDAKKYASDFGIAEDATDRGGRFTWNFFDYFPGKGAVGNNALWKWDGSATPCATPIFEAGEYTVKYTAYYYTYVGAYWADSEKVATDDPAKIERAMFLTNNVLQEKIKVEGEFADKYVAQDVFEVTASIDEGTGLSRSLCGEGSAEYIGVYSINGLLNSAKIAWNNNATFDKVVIAYGGKTVEINDGSFSNSTIIKDLQTSPVDFTVTFYNGATKVSEETVSTDVYVLPETAAGKWVAKADASLAAGHMILGTGWNTDQYCTAQCTFNVYEKGSDTPVFDKDITTGTGSITTYFKWANHNAQVNGVHYSGPGNRACHGGDGNNWNRDDLPTGTVVATGDKTFFQGLDSSKEYVVKYTLKVWPFILDASAQYHAAFDDTAMTGRYFFKRMMAGGNSASLFNAVDLAGEADLTFE